MKCPMCHLETAEGSFCTGCGWKLKAPSTEAEAPGQVRQAEAYLSLQPSEAAVLAAASRIYAAHVIANHVTDENEASLAVKSITMAMRMALMTEKRLQSDDEDH